jgi:hypothetical protein
MKVEETVAALDISYDLRIHSSKHTQHRHVYN